MTPNKLKALNLLKSLHFQTSHITINNVIVLWVVEPRFPSPLLQIVVVLAFHQAEPLLR